MPWSIHSSACRESIQGPGGLRWQAQKTLKQLTGTDLVWSRAQSLSFGPVLGDRHEHLCLNLEVQMSGRSAAW